MNIKSIILETEGQVSKKDIADLDVILNNIGCHNRTLIVDKEGATKLKEYSITQGELPSGATLIGFNIQETITT